MIDRGQKQQGRQVVVDLDELDGLIRKAKYGRGRLADSVAELVSALKGSAVEASPTDDAVSLVARLLLQKLHPDASGHRRIVNSPEAAHAEQMVAQDFTGALALACGEIPTEADEDRSTDLRTRRARCHYLPQTSV